MVRCDDTAMDGGFAATDTRDTGSGGGGDSGILAWIRRQVADFRAWVVGNDEQLAAFGALAGIVASLIAVAEFTGD